MWVFLVAFVLLVLIMLPFIPIYRGVVTGKKAKRSLIFNLASFAAVFAIMTILPLSVSAADTTAALDPSAGLGFIAAAMSVGISGIGGGIAVASGASAALGATSENPKLFGKALIFVAFGEAIALYGMIVAFVILGKF